MYFSLRANDILCFPVVLDRTLLRNQGDQKFKYFHLKILILPLNITDSLRSSFDYLLNACCHSGCLMGNVPFGVIKDHE
jgi:hypothetical protein